MARISFAEVVDLVARHSGWQERGDDDPRTVLQIVMNGGQPADDVPVLDTALAGKTVTYESRHVTVVLDFDERGYLKGLEFV